MQPGSASGSQAQESWHRHKLKKYITELRQNVPAFVSSLESFTRSRLQQLCLAGASLPDLPVEPFPDKFVMYDSPALTALGRSSADQFHRIAAFDTFPDEFGNVWYCMRKTLTSYDQDSCKWTFTADCDVHSLGHIPAHLVFVAMTLPGFWVCKLCPVCPTQELIWKRFARC